MAGCCRLHHDCRHRDCRGLRPWAMEQRAAADGIIRRARPVGRGDRDASGPSGTPSRCKETGLSMGVICCKGGGVAGPLHIHNSAGACEGEIPPPTRIGSRPLLHRPRAKAAAIAMTAVVMKATTANHCRSSSFGTLSAAVQVKVAAAPSAGVASPAAATIPAPPFAQATMDSPAFA